MVDGCSRYSYILNRISLGTSRKAEVGSLCGGWEVGGSAAAMALMGFWGYKGGRQ
jgi:hypothetical protein